MAIRLRLPGTGTVVKLPEPRPIMIDIGERFVVDPLFREEPDLCGIMTLLAMTPTERWRWHLSWHQFVMDALHQGEDLEALVYPKDRPA